MRVLAPAKINLHLRVGPSSDDGFHPLLSWMVSIGLFDTLELSRSTRPGVSLSCDDPSVPCDDTNLVSRVAQALLETAGKQPGQEGTAGLSAALRKRIPAGAGLGGGSSDGAATMLALNAMLKLNWTAQQMSDFLARFGSDLSFFCHGPSSICTGRGQHVRPVRRPAPRWALLLLPPIHMPTPAVYRRFDEMRLGSPAAIADDVDWESWANLDALSLLPHLLNDLEGPAFGISPELAALHGRTADLLGRIVRMSGSGSTLFTLYDTAEQAQQACGVVGRGLGVNSIAVELCPATPDAAAQSTSPAGM